MWGFGEGGRWSNGGFELLNCEREEEEGSRLGHQRHFHDSGPSLLSILVKLSCNLAFFCFQPHKYHLYHDLELFINSVFSSLFSLFCKEERINTKLIVDREENEG